MSIIRIRTCQRCKHSSQGQQGAIECHRYPPQMCAIPLTVVPPGGTRPETVVHQIAAFPDVHPDSFCSEYAPQLAMANNLSEAA